MNPGYRVCGIGSCRWVGNRIGWERRIVRVSIGGWLQALVGWSCAWWIAAVAVLVWVVAISRAAGLSDSDAGVPSVGMEGRLEVVLPEAGLVAVAGDHRAGMVVRIASSQPNGSLTRYDLRYIGRVPGRHDLREYLRTQAGVVATNLPAIPVEVAGRLPTPHNGWLEEPVRGVPWLFGGYRVMMITLVVLWIAGFAILLWVTRRPRIRVVEAPPALGPSLAERLRPLVERAAGGGLSADEKAKLERMLIAHWQQRLELQGMSGEGLIHRLREHPEAGVLLRALEDWLHRPGGREVSVDTLLAPYRDLPGKASSEVRA